MKKRRLGVLLSLLLLTPSLLVPVLAEDKQTTYDAQISAAQSQASGIQAELQTTLAAVNQVYQKAYASQQAVADGQAKIAATTAKIGETEQELQDRQGIMAEQMRQLQINHIESSFFATILSSDSLSDMITRVFSLNTYHKMQEEKMTRLDQSKKSLSHLRSDLEKQQLELEKNEASYHSQSADLEGKLTGLQAQLVANQAELVALSSSKAAEEKRQADALARESASSVDEPTQTDGFTPVTPGGDSGKSMTVSTTGYSSDGADGLTPGHITAIGIDLWVNPMCIAVDPSVIPLGSMVEVPGYGIAIAGDTGGAIKGYKIDLHFKTTHQAINWGRRTVKIKIIS
ncbi:MAG: hypothetical protein LBS41_00345 [Streptococcaceae bacterium]|jgi:cystine transport system substrate-binding protein|nr:hypothetical protein [Streptococcaceae bacterium]